jgi:transposase
MRLFEGLRGLGYSGGYDAVRRHAARWRRQPSATTAAFVPLSLAPGEAYQFDWSHEIVVLKSVTTIVKVAHLRLCHSRMPFVRAYPRASQEMVFDGPSSGADRQPICDAMGGPSPSSRGPARAGSTIT